MTPAAALSHLLFAFGLFLLSSLTCRKLVNRSKFVDRPNNRSSHETPTPTAGGIAIVVSFFCGMGLVFLVGDQTMVNVRIFAGFTLSSLLIAGMSLLDDYRHKPFWARLLTQAIAILLIMGTGVMITRISLPFGSLFHLKIIGGLTTFIWMIGLTNSFNFMDGLNGMAGITAIIACIFLGSISYLEGSNFTYIVCLVLASGTFGFLIFNFPGAKIFMGDVGSTFLGFTFAALAVISALHDTAHTSLLVVPLLLLHFIFDTFFTFCRRLLARENVFSAHRTHLYQLLNQIGFSHTMVSLLYGIMGICQGFAAVYMIRVDGISRLLVFLPFIFFQLCYAIVVVFFARKKMRPETEGKETGG